MLAKALKIATEEIFFIDYVIMVVYKQTINNVVPLHLLLSSYVNIFVN